MSQAVLGESITQWKPLKMEDVAAPRELQTSGD